VFALDLMSTYEGEHTIFGLLGQANLQPCFFKEWIAFSHPNTIQKVGERGNRKEAVPQYHIKCLLISHATKKAVLSREVKGLEDSTISWLRGVV
jgi:hypothetical protein